MEFRRLGRSSIKVSPLGLGTARMAGLGWHDDLAPQDSTQTKREAVRQIQAAVDLGVTFFDTADNYGQGLSERILGEALRGRRECNRGGNQVWGRSIAGSGGSLVLGCCFC